MDDLKINYADKVAWCAMLDSGTMEQAIGALYNGTGYCCLGVFAKVKGASFEMETVTETDDDGNEIEIKDTSEATVEIDGGDLNDNEMLAQKWADGFGITDLHQGFLSRLNDGGEMTVYRDSPLYPLAERYATSSRPEEYPVPQNTRFASSDGRVFAFKRHSFAEISAIIREHF